MEMKTLNSEEVCNILNEIMEYELAGVVRYTHSALMVSGPYRIPIVTFLKEQATESLMHAQQAGELIEGINQGIFAGQIGLDCPANHGREPLYYALILCWLIGFWLCVLPLAAG